MREYNNRHSIILNGGVHVETQYDVMHIHSQNGIKFRLIRILL